MGYRQTRWLKIGLGATATVMLFAVWNPTWEPLNPVWQPSKQRYFNYVAASCSEAHDLVRIPWREAPAFDAKVEEFVAHSEEELATIACINRWAGFLISDHVSPEIAHPTIQFSMGGEHIVKYPATQLIDYAYIRPTD